MHVHGFRARAKIELTTMAMDAKCCRVCEEPTIKNRRNLHSPASSEVYRSLFNILLEYYADSKSLEDIHVLLADRPERYICKRCYSSLTKVAAGRSEAEAVKGRTDASSNWVSKTNLY